MWFFAKFLLQSEILKEYFLSKILSISDNYHESSEKQSF